MHPEIDVHSLTSKSIHERGTILLSFVLAIIILRQFIFRDTSTGQTKIRTLHDPIPFVYNTIQFIFKKDTFLKRVTKAHEDGTILKLWLAGKPVYICDELKQYQAIFSSRDLTYNGIMLQIGFPRLWRMTSDEVQRFADDKSGHKETPLPGHENVPLNQRYRAQKYHILYEFLSRSHQVKPIIDEFMVQFGDVVETFPVGQWTALSIDKLTRRDFTQCSITTLFGPRILEMNPDFLDAFWDFDSYVSVLVYGFPKWVYPAPYRASDRFLDMIEKYLASGLKSFDWNGPEMEAQWEPEFGTRIARDLAKWLTDAGFQPKSVAGALGTLLFGQNSNTIPVVSWMLIELNKDSSLLKAIREEVATAILTDPATGADKLDSQKLVALPLLQFLFAEVLRLRVSMVVMRVVEKPFVVGETTIPTGSFLHAYSQIAQSNDRIWGSAEHPASEFWAERHIRYVDEKDMNTGQLSRKREFALAASSANFFPFGGGVPMCPGRLFARHEVFAMVGILVHRFEMEFVEWTKMDGSPSDRPAKGDLRFASIGSLPPDRDLIVRWRRIK